jgi:hypothetical protein
MKKHGERQTPKRGKHPNILRKHLKLAQKLAKKKCKVRAKIEEAEVCLSSRASLSVVSSPPST